MQNAFPIDVLSLSIAREDAVLAAVRALITECGEGQE